ncbi:MAG: hypothetical protein IJP70_11535 [Bacteroidales bacterium]|nr:hypothetical protein [Bacteroidales bacterium]
MKKLLLLSAACVVMAANAQTESAFMDPVATLGEGAKDAAVAVTAGTVFCQSANIKMEAAWDDTYKIVALAGENDPVKALTIDGVTYTATTGVQGQTNPKENSLLTGGQNSGAVFKFEVAADGYLYVFGKFTFNKNYYVWEGDVANGAGMAVAYTMTAYTVADGSKVGYSLPADELGYYAAMGYNDEGVANFTSNPTYDNGTQYLFAGQKDGVGIDATWTSGNALGVISFPVYKEAGQYFVNACGSKVTCDGFVFIPGATAAATIGAGEAALNEIAADNANGKVAYNILGQRVAANTRGLVIVNGKKVINK